jgi:hypothetical protein
VCVCVCVARSGRGSCRRGKEKDEERQSLHYSKFFPLSCSASLSCPPSLLVWQIKEEQAEILLRFRFRFRFS